MTDPQATLQSKAFCMGCQKELRTGDPVMQLTMDEFAQWQGLPPLGMDDLLKFTLCADCTQQGDSPWDLEPLA